MDDEIIQIKWQANIAMSYKENIIKNTFCSVTVE